MEDKIKEYLEVSENYRKLRDEIKEVVKKAFYYLKKRILNYEYVNNNCRTLLLAYGSWSEYYNFEVKEDNIVIEYYDYGYDCFESTDFAPIPVSIIDNEEKLREWIESKFRYHEVLERAKKEDEDKKTRKKELEELARLKAKYE